ncbi:flagellar filament capping protein FliD [Thermovibrio ammonificans]|uniref:Flagellar hook-associated protein 2 n=1 Tax=Thermovibrio ammonificans (strain DSM 15698 / JCM 12110 / HB-1) TaxID=648996 RepID=E8T2M9_THEA1|nr:flagellar filament capping protein FliD [Thermovibrio ammonificans]ADU97124.1 flagellar hook-associated 2 domain-containing protein [Thermovibrio ammonificans HB-1]
MAGELYISNLVGSFDYQQILSLYYQSQSAPIQFLQQKENTINQKISALKEFQTDIQNLYDAFDTLTSPNLLDSKSVTVSDPSVLTAQVTDPLSAQPGTVDVTVDALAKNDVWLSQAGVTDLSSAVATTSGTIQISYAGQVVATIDYDTDTTDSTEPSTLTEIADAINNAQDKVVASVIYDGSQYRLLLRGVDTGADNTISITEVGGGDLLDQLQLGDNYSSSHVQTAQDAQIDIYGTTITSSTNTFDNALPGVELTVNSTGTTAVTVTQDFQPFKDALDKFVNAYNTIVDFLNDKAGKDGILADDTSLFMIRSSILSKMDPLFQLGILDVDKDTGHVSVDSAKLDDLLNSNPSAVEDAITDLKNSMQDYLLFLEGPDSPVENQIDNYNNEISSIEDQIDFLNKNLKEQMDVLKQQLIQVQLLQAQMEEIKAKLTSVFGTPTLFPTNTTQ